MRPRVVPRSPPIRIAGKGAALTVISTPSSARMSAAYDEASSDVDIVRAGCGCRWVEDNEGIRVGVMP